jgi:hypothetical protein
VINAEPNKEEEFLDKIQHSKLNSLWRKLFVEVSRKEKIKIVISLDMITRIGLL